MRFCWNKKKEKRCLWTTSTNISTLNIYSLCSYNWQSNMLLAYIECKAGKKALNKNETRGRKKRTFLIDLNSATQINSFSRKIVLVMTWKKACTDVKPVVSKFIALFCQLSKMLMKWKKCASKNYLLTAKKKKNGNEMKSQKIFVSVVNAFQNPRFATRDKNSRELSFHLYVQISSSSIFAKSEFNNWKVYHCYRSTWIRLH